MLLVATLGTRYLDRHCTSALVAVSRLPEHMSRADKDRSYWQGPPALGLLLNNL
jgi:hypothetical protein